ncbi:hypothetical protein ZWY2020_059728 [Hordeum vulgare]|nr:hypothetical protein ZWY2020_059728 [Hordeum vulgare]
MLPSGEDKALMDNQSLPMGQEKREKETTKEEVDVVGKSGRKFKRRVREPSKEHQEHIAVGSSWAGVALARLCERLSPRRRAINRLQVEARRRLSTRLLGEAGERSPCAAHWGALATCVSLPEASKQQQQQPSSLAPRAAARLTCPASPSLDSCPLLTLGVSKEEGKLLRRWFLGTPGGRHSGSCTVRSIKANTKVLAETLKLLAEKLESAQLAKIHRQTVEVRYSLGHKALAPMAWQLSALVMAITCLMLSRTSEQSSESELLQQLRKQLEYPRQLDVWNNPSGNPCYTQPTSVVTVYARGCCY